MAREIKLKAHHPELGLSAPVLVGSKDLAFTFDEGRIYYTLSNLPHGTEFLQFAGLVDKNGVEVYEGDQLRCPMTATVRTIGLVHFHRGQFCVDLGFDAEHWSLGSMNSEDIEVVK